MIWEYWRQSELEGALSPALLDRLEVVVDRLSEGRIAGSDIYLRKNLVPLVAAFTPSNAFTERAYLRRCFNRLPPRALEEVAAIVGVGVEAQSFEERVAALVRRGWGNDPGTRALAEYFGVPLHFIPDDRRGRRDSRSFRPPSVSSPTEIDSPYLPLKDYQVQVCQDAMVQLEPPRARFILQMPTGAGKTRTAMEILTTFLRKVAPGTTVLWLAHSEELCEQAFQAFGEVWQHVGTVPLMAYRGWGSHPIPTPSGTAFVVTSFQKLYSVLGRDAPVALMLRNETSLIVVDEAHKAVAPTYRKAIRAVTSDTTRVLGLTATPGRTDESESQELADFFFGALVGIRAPEGESALSMLRARGILARGLYDPLVTSRSYELSPTELKALEERFDFPAGFLKRVGADDVRNIEIMKRLMVVCAQGKRVLVFATSVEQSKFFSALLMFFGIGAAHLDGGTSKARRREVITSFKEGALQVLSNFGVLTTGFDAPQTDVVVIARPTASPVLYSQMIGRGLRGPEIGGTAVCTLIDVRDNIVGFGNQDRVYRLFAGYFEDA